MVAKTKNQAAKAVAKKSAAPENDGAASKMALLPSVNAAAIIEAYSAPMGEQDIGTLMDSLNESMEKVWDGDMKRCEAMLLGQAHALQAIFMNLSRRAIKQEYLKNYETFLRLGLKAQSQCRATLETLATIKNPPVTIVRQANIAHGPQQVNNGVMPNTAPATEQVRTGENQNPQTQLMESNDGEWLDTGTASTASRNDQEMAAVGEIDRPQNNRR